MQLCFPDVSLLVTLVVAGLQDIRAGTHLEGLSLQHVRDTVCGTQRARVTACVCIRVLLWLAFVRPVCLFTLRDPVRRSRAIAAAGCVAIIVMCCCLLAL